MKVIILNGSPRDGGNCSIAINEMKRIFAHEGVEYVEFCIGKEPVRGCIACGGCKKSGRCVFNDCVNGIADELKDSEGLILASPVYYASANATLIACLDRLFHSVDFDLRMKVGACVVCARRGGCSSTFDELNKYFTISGMPVASSQYWNSVHGLKPGDAAEDEEGLQTARTLARNMVFLMKSIALGKEKYGLPEEEPYTPTNFIG